MFCKVYIATSLDGYIAGPNSELDWLEELPNPDESDFGFFAHMEAMDAVVMGRGTFNAVQAFRPWPYEKPVVVVSSSLSKVPDDLVGKVEIVSGDPADIIAQCADRGFENLYVDGGKLVASFLAAGLIDEMAISTVPILLGDGIRLFGRLEAREWWEHISTESFAGGMVQSTYRSMSSTG